MKKRLEVPELASEDEEREFWAQVNLADYYEPEDAQEVIFPNLKPTSRAISIRFPEYVLDRVKERTHHPLQEKIPLEHMMPMFP
jgi:predicted DNA binding CopG/RHH family protein